MSQHANFRIVYDGSSLRDHSMDVRDLAPALLSLGKLLDSANAVLNGDRATVRLEVRALEPGSFGIDLGLSQAIVDQVTALLTGDVVVSALNLKEILFAGGFSLWALFKWLKGRRPDRLEKLSDGQVKITIGEESHVFPLKLIQLYDDLAVRRAVEEMLQPLQREGIESFSVKSDGVDIATATKEERIYFSSQPDADSNRLLSDREYEGVFAIIALSFKGDNKWRLSDGLSTFGAAILDQTFLERVDDRKEAFYKGDLLRCLVRTRQWDTGDGLKTEHEVQRVIEHIQSGNQLKLFNAIENKKP